MKDCWMWLLLTSTAFSFVLKVLNLQPRCTKIDLIWCNALWLYISGISQHHCIGVQLWVVDYEFVNLSVFQCQIRKSKRYVDQLVTLYIMMMPCLEILMYISCFRACIYQKKTIYHGKLEKKDLGLPNSSTTIPYTQESSKGNASS